MAKRAVLFKYQQANCICIRYIDEAICPNKMNLDT